MSVAKKRNRGFGSNASLGLTANDEFEMNDVMKNRPPSAHSRTAWSDDELLSSGPGVDEIDFSPRTPPSVHDISPMGMDAQSQKHLANGVRTSTVNKNIPVGCGTSFKRIIRSLWRTRQTEDTKVDRELHIRTTLRELIIYIIFVIILCILTFGMTNSNMYFYTKVMRDLFVESQIGNTTNTLKSVSNQQLFWDYALDPMVDGLYWEQYYNKENATQDDLGFIYFENKILGRPRLRQLRVTNSSCKVHEHFKKSIKRCYAMYSTGVEDKAPFGLKNGTAWNYQSEAQLQSIPYWGRITTYGGGGYTKLLTDRKKSSVEIIETLKKNRWIDRGTRAVFVDFTVYNANINLFCIIRLFFEFPATGGCIPSYNFRAVKLIRYVTTMDYFVMACETVFVLFMIYYTIEEVLEISKHRMKYFYSFWNVLDVIVLILGYMCIIYNLYRTVEVDILLKGLLQHQEQYANFDALGFYQTQFNNVLAIAVFFAWIKVFKYISFNKTMTQLSSTLSRCAKDVAGFAIMFFIIFFAYAQLGYLLFGTQVQDFSTFEDSIFTLFRIILGDFDFHQIEDANRILGPAFFMTYVFFVFFVLLNMFLAIINDTYAEVKSDIAAQPSEFEITDYLKKGYQKMLDKLSFKREKIIDIQKALKTADVNQDNKLDFEELRADLKFRGHADAEIEAVFAKYDLDGDRILDEEEQKRMQEDLEGQKAELNEEIDDINRAKEEIVPGSDMDSDDDNDTSSTGLGGRAGSPTVLHLGGGSGRRVSHEEFNVLARRVDRLEHSIGSIVSKIDAVLVKLEAMEKAKHKRRETMAKLLESITESDGRGGEGGRREDREQMEKLVREELERWDSESNMNRDGTSPPPGSRASTAMSLNPRSAAGTRDRSPSRGSTGSYRFQEPQSIAAVFNEHSNV